MRGMTARPLQNIRNFSIVAHIDHGKSTLADRLIQITGGLTEREMAGREQVLDSMDIERERGITIKAQTVRLAYRARDGKDYILNLIDTPGHVDFAYEVNRSLAACEGSLLVVDASQGVEAQTLANVYQAIDNNHEVVPVLNKIDLPAAEPEKVKQQIEDVIGLDASHAILISAKTGLNIEAVLEAIVTRLPPPKGDPDAPLKALLVDSWYDSYLGVVVLVRIVDGAIKRGQRIRLMGTGASYEVDRVGVFTPKTAGRDRARRPARSASSPRRSRTWPTPVSATPSPTRGNPRPRRCPASARRCRWCSAAYFRWTPPTSRICARRWASCASTMRASPMRWRLRAALGFGFRCGFLGLLHLEIIQERLAREFNLDLIATAPSVIYKMTLTDGGEIEIHNPVDMPDVVKIKEIHEPWITRDHPHARRLSRQRAEAVPGPARRAGGPLLCRRAGAGEIRAAAQRGGVRFLRPAEVGVEGLCLVRLSPHRLSAGRSREDADSGQRRAGRRARHAGAPDAARKAAAAPWWRS